MWWQLKKVASGQRPETSRKDFRLASGIWHLASILLLLTACDLRPMYGETNRQQSAELAAVSVSHIPGKIGQQLKDSLEDALYRAGNANKKYTLTIKLERTVVPVLIDKERGISRYHVLLKCDYALTDGSGGKLEENAVTARSSYNVVDNKYATFVAEQNADTQNIRDLTDRLMARLSIVLADKQVHFLFFPAAMQYFSVLK